MPHEHKFLCNDRMHFNLCGNPVQPVFHRQSMRIGAATADKKEIGVSFFAYGVHGFVDRRAQGNRVIDNLFITGNIEIEHTRPPFVL